MTHGEKLMAEAHLVARAALDTLRDLGGDGVVLVVLDGRCGQHYGSAVAAGAGLQDVAERVHGAATAALDARGARSMGGASFLDEGGKVTPLHGRGQA